MNSQHFELLKELVNPNYALQAEQSRNSRSAQITTLLSQRRFRARETLMGSEVSGAAHYRETCAENSTRC